MRPSIRTLFAVAALAGLATGQDAVTAEWIFHNGRIATQSDEGFVEALAVRGERVLAVGDADELESVRGPKTKVVDLGGRTLIPGLNDSHLHVTRGGRFFATELRWEGVPSLKMALDRVRHQAARTPEGQWVRVVGGWSPYQFEERRMPTIHELNEAAPDTPTFVLFLYSKGFLNRAGVEALGLTPDTEVPPGTRIKFVDGGAELLGEPSPALLYQTIGKLPGLSTEDQVVSTRYYLHELARLGLTSASDPGGGGHAFPIDYEATEQVADLGTSPFRIGYYLFPQKRGQEESKIEQWTETMTPDVPNVGAERASTLLNGYALQGAGENLVWAAGDYENFLAPRPELKRSMDRRLEAVVRLLAKNNWAIRLHATYGESIERFLDVFERVNRDISLTGRRWALDHAETITDEQLARVARLGGGIAIQDRMAFAGEYFVERYGAEKAAYAPPLRKMLEAGIPLGAGTDGTRVSSYDPWTSLYWMVSGKTVGGLQLYGPDNRLRREEALRLYTVGSAWWTGDDGRKGRLAKGQLADFAVLDRDYFTCDLEEIREIRSVLTVVGGHVAFADAEYKVLDPQLPPLQPSWSPVALYGGVYRSDFE